MYCFAFWSSVSNVCTIQEIIHIILNALHLRNWRGRNQSLLFEVLEQFLGNSIVVESFGNLSSPGKTFVLNLHLSGVVGLRSTKRYPYGLRTASSYSLINQAVSLGYICLARVKICSLSRGFLKRTK